MQRQEDDYKVEQPGRANILSQTTTAHYTIPVHCVFELTKGGKEVTLKFF